MKLLKRIFGCFNKPAQQPLSIEEAVCKVFGVTPEQLRSKDRLRPHVEARYCLYNMLYYRGVSSVSIGKAYNRDHSTVIYGRDTCEAWKSCDKEFLRKFNQVKSMLS